jgi:hypothetical protein
MDGIELNQPASLLLPEPNWAPRLLTSPVWTPFNRKFTKIFEKLYVGDVGDHLLLPTSLPISNPVDDKIAISQVGGIEWVLHGCHG